MYYDSIINSLFGNVLIRGLRVQFKIPKCLCAEKRSVIQVVVERSCVGGKIQISFLFLSLLIFKETYSTPT